MIQGRLAFVLCSLSLTGAVYEYIETGPVGIDLCRHVMAKILNRKGISYSVKFLHCSHVVPRENVEEYKYIYFKENWCHCEKWEVCIITRGNHSVCVEREAPDVRFLKEGVSEVNLVDDKNARVDGNTMETDQYLTLSPGIVYNEVYLWGLDITNIHHKGLNSMSCPFAIATHKFDVLPVWNKYTPGFQYCCGNSKCTVTYDEIEYTEEMTIDNDNFNLSLKFALHQEKRLLCVLNESPPVKLEGVSFGNSLRQSSLKLVIHIFNVTYAHFKLIPVRYKSVPKDFI